MFVIWFVFFFNLIIYFNYFKFNKINVSYYNVIYGMYLCFL